MMRGRSKLWVGVALLAGVIWTGGAVGVSAPPSNDNLANAIPLTGADVSRTGDLNVGATLEPGEDTTVAGSPAGASVWYSWTAPMNGIAVIDTANSGFDTLLGVYTGSAVGALAEVTSNDDFVHPPTSLVRFFAATGTTYRIRVDGYADAQGTINLRLHQALPPANDNFASPTPLSGQNASSPGTNDGATLEPDEADTVAGAPAGASVWYTWTAPATGLVKIDTATSDFDTLLGVYTGSAVGSLTEIAGNDDAKFPPTSLVRFSAASGTTYRIRVDGFREQSGTINLHLQEVPPSASPANDNFASAVPLSGTTASSGGTNAGATLEAGEAASVAGEPAGNSVWYAWTAPTAGTVTIDTATSTFDTLLGAYTGSAVGAVTPVASNDDVGTTDLTSSIRFQATSGAIYRIRVDGYAGDTGTITLHVNENRPPANDDFANAYFLSGANDARTNDTNVDATRQSGLGEASTVAGQTANTSVWYRWTAPQTTAVTIDTATSDFDTLLAVYTGNALNNLADVASNDNVGPSDHTSKVAFPTVAGTEYRIRVDGPPSATGTIRLHLALATVSDVPTDVTASPGNGEATVSWIAPGSDGGSPITGYDVTRYEAGQAPVTTNVGAVTEVFVGGLTNGTTYTFRVAARNAAGTGLLSDNSNPVTPRTVPDAPTGVSATAAAGQATVSWSAPAYNGGSAITGYAVTRYVNETPQGTTNVGIVSQATVSGLTNGTTYTFKVAAKNAAGAGALSAASNAVTPLAVPDAPTGVSATAGSEQATVHWTTPASDGGTALTGYDVTRYVGGVTQGTTSVGVTTQATVTGLTNGTAYTFRVTAKNALGNGPQSTDSNAVTPMTVPSAPTITSASAANGQATVIWAPPASNGGGAVAGYDVTRYVSGIAVGTTSVGVVSQTTVNGLTNGMPYTFRVAAKNAAGTGAQSADSNPVTPAAPVPPATVKYTLKVTKSGAGTGSVTSSFGPIDCGAVCAGDYDQGASVILTATALSGSTFAGWSGACTGTGSCTVAIDAAKTATATFNRSVPQPQSPGAAAKCTVPNVKGKPLATAKRKISAAHCKVGKVTKIKSKAVKKGSVVSQKPAARKKLAAGSKVGLVVSSGKP